jgi:NitT/TauT family transport system ATP-binding protein
MDDVLSLSGVTHRFTTADGRTTTALRDFDLAVHKGEFLGIVGPTGCGKSTLLNLITGLLQPTRGEVRVGGKPVGGVPPDLGFVFQTDALFPWRTVLDNVAAGPLFRGEGRARAHAKARDWLARVGLDRFELHHPHQLSGGMRKRAALAQTFVNEPRLLLMDEPFSALDVQTRTVMQDELLALWSGTGTSVLFVTHDLEEAVGLADRVVVLTASPATVKAVYDVPLPRPRRIGDLRYEPDFTRIARAIWDDLRAEVSLGQARAAQGQAA